jgi:hypothetical protein
MIHSDMFLLLEAIFRLIIGSEHNGDALPKNYKLLTLCLKAQTNNSAYISP